MYIFQKKDQKLKNITILFDSSMTTFYNIPAKSRNWLRHEGG